MTLSDMPIEGFVHISQLGWGYFVYDPAKQTMTSHEEMTEIRLGDQLTVRLEGAADKLYALEQSEPPSSCQGRRTPAF